MNTSSFLLKQGSISSILTLFFLLLSLFFVNLQINILGIKQYGLLVLLLSVFGTINMLNIGIGTAIVNYYTKYGKDKSVFWSIFIASFISILFLSIIILTIISIFYQDIFQLLGVGDQGLNIMAFYGFSLIGISRLLSTITSSYWTSTVNFFKLKIFGFVNIYFSITFILIFYWLGFSLNDSLFYSGVLNFIFICTLTLKIVIGSMKLSIRKIILNVKSHVREFALNGFQFQGLAIINNLSNPIVNIMINTHFGLEAVSLFDIALKLLRSGRQIIVSATEPFFGKITELANKHKYIAMRLIVLKFTKYISLAALFYFIGILLVSKFVLTLWVGSSIANSIYLWVYIISFGLSINIISSIIYYSFLAIKKYRKFPFYHQLIQLMIFVIPFYFAEITLEKYMIFYSAAYAISSLYLIAVFMSIKKHKS